MEIIRSMIAVVLWWTISSIGSWLESKMPPKGFRVLCWIMMIPLALVGYVTAPMLVSIGVFWPVLSFPAFVGIGMLIAPNYRRWIPGIFLLCFIFLMGFHTISTTWELEKTRQWMAGAAGLFLAILAFWKLRFGDRELTEDEQHANLLAALGCNPDGSRRQP